MQLQDIVRPIEQMSDEELLERIREVRKNRDVVRVTNIRRAEHRAGKASAAKVGALEKLLASLPTAEREKIIRELKST